MPWGPSNSKYHVMVPVFDGGLNTKIHASELPLHQSPDLKNVEFDDRGAVGTINGITKFNSTTVGSAVIDGLGAYVTSSGTGLLVAACNGDIYYASGVASGTTFATIGSLQSVYTAGEQINMVVAGDQLFFANGYTRSYRYDGTGAYRMLPGDITTETVSAVCINAGNLNGTYYYYLTTENTFGVETDGTLQINSIAVNNGDVEITSIPTSPGSHGVEYINIYRNTAGGGSSELYRVDRISNGVTAYTDDVADTSLTVAYDSTYGAEPLGKYSISHRNRLWIAGNPDYPNRLYYSEIDIPGKFGDLNFVEVGFGDGENISGLSEYGGKLYIHKKRSTSSSSIWVLHIPDDINDTTDANWVLEKTPSPYGAVSHLGQAHYSNLLFFFSKFGCYSFQGRDISLNTADSDVGQFGVEAQSYDIEPDMFTVNQDYFNLVAAIEYNNKIWLSVPYDTGTTNNRIYTYDYQRGSDINRTKGAWSLITDVNIANFVVHDGKLFGSSSAEDGFVYELDTGHTNAGTAIDSYYVTAPISGLPEHKYNSKTFRYLYITVEMSGNWYLYINSILNYRDEEGTQTRVNLNPQSSLWGSFYWDTDVWGAPYLRRRIRVPLANAIGTAIQFKFHVDNLSEYWKVHEIEVAYTLQGKR